MNHDSRDIPFFSKVLALVHANTGHEMMLNVFTVRNPKLRPQNDEIFTKDILYLAAHWLIEKEGDIAMKERYAFLFDTKIVKYDHQGNAISSKICNPSLQDLFSLFDSVYDTDGYFRLKRDAQDLLQGMDIKRWSSQIHASTDMESKLVQEGLTFDFVHILFHYLIIRKTLNASQKHFELCLMGYPYPNMVPIHSSISEFFDQWGMEFFKYLTREAYDPSLSVSPVRACVGSLFDKYWCKNELFKFSACEFMLRRGLLEEQLKEVDVIEAMLFTGIQEGDLWKNVEFDSCNLYLARLSTTLRNMVDDHFPNPDFAVFPNLFRD